MKLTKKSWLFSNKLWMYPVVYMALTILFSIIYYQIPQHFYHSTIPHEPETNTVKQNLLPVLSEEIFRNLFPKIPYKTEIDGWNINIYAYDINISPKNNKDEQFLTIDALVKGRNKSHLRFEGLYEFIISSKPLSLGSSSAKVLRNKHGEIETLPQKSYRVRKMEIKELKLLRDRSVIIRKLSVPDITKYFKCDKIPFPYDNCINLTSEADNKVNEYGALLQGKPRSSDGGYRRMLYLSATTITTLGLGDILPLTTLARSLVTIESLLGPLLFGLFLAALVERLKPTTDSDHIKNHDKYIEKKANTLFLPNTYTFFEKGISHSYNISSQKKKYKP